MKKWLVIFLSIAATDAVACKDGRTLRVRFQSCPAQEDSIDVRVGGNADFTLLKVREKVYEYELPGPIGTNLSLKIDSNPPICCTPTARLVPEPPPSIDCDVEYVVYCDPPPSWAIRGVKTGDVTFKFAAEHPAKFETCPPLDVTAIDGWLTGLRSLDTVKVAVLSKNREVVKFPVTLTNFTSPRVVKSSDELRDLILKSSHKPPEDLTVVEKSVIESRLALVPKNGVTVEKR